MITDVTHQNLSQHGCTIARNCIHIWIFVQDVDVQYAGMVDDYIEQHYHGIPKVPVLVPVCRPEWLVETGYLVIKQADNARLMTF